jgi:hypothetical protein
VCSQAEAVFLTCNPAVSFLRACKRSNDVVWGFADYYFRVNREEDSCEVAIGILSDWQKSLSQSELHVLAERWLMYRLGHGYDPFRDSKSQRTSEVPFTVVNYWLMHSTLPPMTEVFTGVTNVVTTRSQEIVTDSSHSEVGLKAGSQPNMLTKPLHPTTHLPGQSLKGAL